MRVDHVVIAVATPPGAALLYFLLAGEVSQSEAIACAPVVAVASFYALILARSGTVELRLAGRGMLSLLRGCVAVVPDTWRVGRGLMQAVRRRPDEMQGVVTHVPLRFGGVDRDDVGRRAAVVAAISLAPNGFAVGMERERDELIVHQLVPAPIGGDREWPQ
jgi:hypothetical protein